MITVKQGFKVKLSEAVKKAMFRNVLAEEPAPQPQVTPQQSQPINYEDLIKKARQEEKDKLYPQIEAERNKTRELTEKNNDLLLKVGQLQSDYDRVKAELDSIKEGKGIKESEVVTKLKEDNANLKKEYDALKNSVVDENLLRQEIEKEVKAQYEVELYKVEKMSSDEFKGQIIPELVTGTTKEEIDESLEHSKNRYLELIGGVPQQGGTSQVNPQQVPTPPAGNPTVQNFTQGVVTTDDINAMTPEQWAEYRVKLGLR